MGLVETVAPTAQPVSLEQVKAHLRVEHDYDDDWITNAIGEAVAFVVANTRHQITLSATYRYTLDCFPSGRVINLPMAKAQSVTSVQYVDTDGNTQTFAASNYTSDVDSKPARIVLNEDSAWAQIDSVPAAVTITYVAGYADAASVPATAKALIREIVALRYANRETAVTGTIVSDLPFTGQVILNQLTFHEAV